MSFPTREEIDAKLESLEVRIDRRFASVEAKIDGLGNLMSERWRANDERLARLEAISADTQNYVRTLKTTIVVTAIPVVLGISAVNATILASMVASFESGKSTASAQADLKRQVEETAALLKRMQEQYPAQEYRHAPITATG